MFLYCGTTKWNISAVMFLFPGAQEHISLGICVSRVGEHISLGIGGFSSMRGKRPRYGCVCDSSYRLLPRTAEKILWHFKFFSIRVHSLPLQNEVQLLICRFSRAKSEALFNIYSLLKHNIKSCNVKRRRQRERQKKNSNRSNLQNINFARAAHFFVHFFAVALFCTTTTWNWFKKFFTYRFCVGNAVCVSVRFFNIVAHFGLSGR